MTALRQRILWALLIGLAIAVPLVLARRDSGTLDPLASSALPWLVYKVALLAFIGMTVAVMFRRRFAQALTAALAWIALALVLLVGYSYRFELRGVADHVLAELLPGHVISHGRSVELAR